MEFSKYGLQVPKTLLPKSNVDWTKWSVIAVDQYTSQMEYWDEVDRMVGNAPSTLRLVWPEAWLESDKNSHNPDSIKSKMHEYMRSDIFEEKTGFIHTQRTLRNGEVRSGLVANIDLECYEFNPKEEALIKSTEGTIVTRLPARIDVREKADLEVTHVMLLIDDRQNLLMRMLDSLDKDIIYDFDLMMNSGHIIGNLVSKKDEAQIAVCLEKIIAKNRSKTLFGVGDGNHSLAAAKSHWENIKGSLSREELLLHPSRFAMVEIVNLYDRGLGFEPIHRIVKSDNADLFFEKLIEEFKQIGEVSPGPISDAFHYKYCLRGKTHDIYLSCNYSLAITALQETIDNIAKTDSHIIVDYIHGEDVVKQLSSGNVLGIILPDFQKSGLFKTIEKGKVLPRKSFSMGMAHEKRFYLECRFIK